MNACSGIVAYTVISGNICLLNLSYRFQLGKVNVVSVWAYSSTQSHQTWNNYCLQQNQVIQSLQCDTDNLVLSLNVYIFKKINKK